MQISLVSFVSLALLTGSASSKTVFSVRLQGGFAQRRHFLFLLSYYVTQGLSVNGVDQGHAVGVRVPSSNNVRLPLPTSSNSSTE